MLHIAARWSTVWKLRRVPARCAHPRLFRRVLAAKRRSRTFRCGTASRRACISNKKKTSETVKLSDGSHINWENTSVFVTQFYVCRCIECVCCKQQLFTNAARFAYIIKVKFVELTFGTSRLHDVTCSAALTRLDTLSQYCNWGKARDILGGHANTKQCVIIQFHSYLGRSFKARSVVTK